MERDIASHRCTMARSFLLRIGFTEIVVHPSGKTHRTISLRRMSREGDNRNSSRSLSLIATDQASRRIAVHPGHLAIHEDQVVWDTRNGLNSLLPGAHAIHSTPQRLQHGERNLVVDWIVFGHQYPTTHIRRSHRHVLKRRIFPLLRGGLLSDMHTIWRLHSQRYASMLWKGRCLIGRSQRCVGNRAKPYRKPKRRSLADEAINPNRSPHKIDQSFDNRKT